LRRLKAVTRSWPPLDCRPKAQSSDRPR